MKASGRATGIIRRTRRRPWRAVLLTLAMLGLLLEVVIHVILNTGVLSRSLSSADGGLVVDWGPAWMLVPGRVHVRDFQMDVQQVGATWRLQVEHATTWVSMSSLRNQELALSGTQAEGVRFALRPNSDGLDGLDVPLLSPPPLRPIVPAPILGSAAPVPWRLRFTDAEVQGLQEVWLGPYRVLFHRARVQARGRFHSGRLLEFAGITLENAAGEIWRGTDFRGVRIVEGHVKGGLDAQGDPQKEQPLDVIGGLAADAAFELAVDDLGFLLRLADPGVLPPESLSGGAGRARLVASIDRGVLQPGSGLKAHGEEVRLDFPQGRIEGAYALEAAIPEGLADGQGRSYVDFQVRHPRLYTTEDTLLAEAPHFSLRGEALRGTRLDASPETRWLGVEFPEPATVRLPALSAWLGGIVEITEGEAQLELSLTLGEAQEERPQRLRLTSGDFVARFGSSVIRGRLEARLRDTPPALDPQKFDLGTLAMGLTRLSVENEAGEEKVTDWSGRLALRGLTVRTEPPSISARLTGKLESAEPAVQLLVENSPVPRVLGGLMSAKNLNLSSNLWMTPRLISVRDLQLAGDGLSVKGELRLRSGVDPDAVLLVKKGILTGGVGLERGRLEVHLFRPYTWFRKELTQRSARR